MSTAGRAQPVRYALPWYAPVAQGIEHRPPEAGAQVRILPGAPRLTSQNGQRGAMTGGLWIQSRYSLFMAGRRSRPRGHIETLSSGNFRAKVYAGIDPLTRKRRYLVEAAASEGAATIALTKLQCQVDEDRRPKTAITVRHAITTVA